MDKSIAIEILIIDAKMDALKLLRNKYNDDQLTTRVDAEMNQLYCLKTNIPHTQSK